MADVNFLQTRNLSRHFGGIKAVDDVNFTLPVGQIRALIGPNGAGKTTFVSLVTGRVPAQSGTVHFDGHDVTKLPPHRRISLGMGYTFQITSVFDDLDCQENVLIAAQRNYRGRARGLRERVRRALEQVGLNAYRDNIARDLSYGHQRLLEIAMGIAQKPKLLILDEPTQGLAGGEIKDFIHLIRELSESTTILLIEHNMDVVMNLAEVITVMDQGRIIAEGSPSEIQANEAVQEAYLGAPHASD